MAKSEFEKIVENYRQNGRAKEILGGNLMKTFDKHLILLQDVIKEGELQSRQPRVYEPPRKKASSSYFTMTANFKTKDCSLKCKVI
jgi:hypothetical protein